MAKNIKRTTRTTPKVDINNSARNPFLKKRKECILSLPNAPEVTYKNPELLVKFISEGGRKLPRRVTNICSKKQRHLSRQINIARILALLPFTMQVR